MLKISKQFKHRGASILLSILRREEMAKVFTTQKRAITWALAVLLSVSVLGVTRLAAQADKGTMSGTATDTSGAVIVGANIEVKDAGTGVTYPTVTDSQGHYIVPDLTVGVYQVLASKSGFHTIVHSGITLTVGAHLLVDFKLPVGEATQVITVTGEVSQVDSTTATVSSLVASKQMQDLPLNGRNFEQLLSLAPGVQSISQNGGGGGVSSTFYGAESNYSVSGSRPVGQSFLLDNTDISNFWQHGTGSSVTGNSLGMDAIQEFSVLTNTYSAEYGGTGAAVNAVTKSGTNALHGSPYEYLRNSIFDAKNYFDVAKLPIPSFRRNQFGIPIGGPIKKDKLFFFFNYEGLRSSQGITGRSLVPETSIISSLIGGDAPPCTDSQTAAAGTLTCVMAPVLALYPAPTAGATTVGTFPGFNAWHYSQAPQVVNEDYILGRLDYVMGAKDSIFARYVHDGATQHQPYPASTLPYWPETDKSGDHYFTMEERHTISSSMVNAARVSIVRTNEGAVSVSTLPAATDPLRCAVTGAACVPGQQDITVGVGYLASMGPSSSSPFQIVQNKYSGGDDVIFSLGKHSLRFGAVFSRVQSNMSSPFGESGYFIFGNFASFVGNDTEIDLTSGAPNSVYTGGGQNIPFNLRHYFRDNELAPYVQDDWKVTPKLTVNIGVRWDYISNAVAAGGVPMEGVTNALTNTSFVTVPRALASNPNMKNFDPRIGLAWDPFKDHKTSVRAGFGIFHEPVAARTYAPAYYLTPPTVSYEASTPFPCFPNDPSCSPSTSNPAIFAGLDYKTNRAPYVMQYNLTIQRQITAGTVFSIGYIGSAGVHLFSEHDANPMLYQSEATFANGTPNPLYNPTASGAPGSVTNPFDGFLACGIGVEAGCLGGAPIINFAFANQSLGGIASDEATAHSSYNSLQTSVNRQFSRDIIGQVAYTWSRCIDDGSSSSGLEQGSYEVTDTYNQSYDRGPCGFNVTQSLRINGVYGLPFKGNRTVTGWSVSPIFQASTGLPISVLDGLSAGGQAGFGGIEGPRPDMVPGCKPYLRTWQNWYNSACYYLPPYGTLGNVGRDNLIGPGFMDLDLSFLKDTKLTEKVSMQFRAEFFNILNHTSFGNPAQGFTFEGDAIGWPLVNPGAPSTNPADYQVTHVTPAGSLVCNSNTAFPSSDTAAQGTCANPSAGQIGYTAEAPREIQFSVRFTF
jgi:hypothetical protein